MGSDSTMVENWETFDIINLSSHPLSGDESEVLHLGLTFSPDEEADRFQLIKDLHLFARRLMYKVLYDKDQGDTLVQGNNSSALENITFEDLKALQDLMELWDESNPEEEGWVFTPPEVSRDDISARPLRPPVL